MVYPECFHAPVFLATCKASASKRISNVPTKENRRWRVGGTGQAAPSPAELGNSIDDGEQAVLARRLLRQLSLGTVELYLPIIVSSRLAAIQPFYGTRTFNKATYFVNILYPFSIRIVHFIISNQQSCASLFRYDFKLCVYHYEYCVISS